MVRVDCVVAILAEGWGVTQPVDATADEHVLAFEIRRLLTRCAFDAFNAQKVILPKYNQLAPFSLSPLFNLQDKTRKNSSSFKNKHKEEQTKRVIAKQAHKPLGQPDNESLAPKLIFPLEEKSGRKFLRLFGSRIAISDFLITDSDSP